MNDLEEEDKFIVYEVSQFVILSYLNVDMEQYYSILSEKDKKQIRTCDALGINYGAVFLGSNITKHGIRQVDYCAAFCPTELREKVTEIKLAWKVYYNDPQNYSDSKKNLHAAIKSLARDLENIIRVEEGLPKIGEGWVSETKLHQIVKKLYPEEFVKFHYRGPELKGLELDIWLPARKIGIEYQGIQHYKPISIWGGEVGLIKQQGRDQRKAKLCEKLGIHLIYVTYQDRIEVEIVKHILSKYL